MDESLQQPFRAAAAQFAPVFLDRRATLEKACDLMADAARQRIRLLAFSESFLPGYPDWVWAIPAGEQGLLNELYESLAANSIDIPGPETDRLCKAARQTGLFTIMGVSERNTEASGGSLYNTLLFIDAQGRLVGKHRKLVPTGGERLVWAQGDGSTLHVFDTSLGKVGGLICWENYMPLARYALYGWGVQIYIAATWDRGEPWISTLRHIAQEGGVYVIGAGMPLRQNDIPDRLGFKSRYGDPESTWINSGDSAVVAPGGEILAGPLHEAEGFVCAEIDLARVRGSRWMLDVAGHYSRPDVFHLTVHLEPRPIVRSETGDEKKQV